MEKSADICLVVEGCYPYITGGVSSWVQWLVENMNQYRFSLVALIAEEMPASERKYQLPENVLSYQEHVIFEYDIIQQAQPLKLSKKKWQDLSEGLYRMMKEWREGELSENSFQLLKEIITEHSPNIFKNFIEDEQAFALTTRIYEDQRGDSGFLKYFYNRHNIHLVLYRLLAMVSKLPPASIYHSPGTGYAGLVACLHSKLFGKKSFITEHGIYLQEREMELLKSDWLDNPYLKDMWIDMFSALCRWQYHSCDILVTLTQMNKELQVEYGAKPERIQVVPNGIDIQRFKKARRMRCKNSTKNLGLVGRVDSVKDVKTFIQTLSIIKKKYADIKGFVIGPFDEQPQYYKECQQLVDILALKDTIVFTGGSDVLAYYEKMDVLLLTSIKEAMPLVVMEAMASGIPVVATAVGACKELLEGNDDGIGPAGIVVRVMDAESIADASLRVMKDPNMANRMAQNGIQRIEKYYREELVIKEYNRIYEEGLHGGHNIPARKAS